MRTTICVRSAGLHFGALLAALVATAPSRAATIEVSVVDDQGRPIENVAVYATPAHGSDHEGTGAAIVESIVVPTAVMDQKSLQFTPHLLVVQSGTSVTFPNTD